MFRAGPGGVTEDFSKTRQYLDLLSTYFLLSVTASLEAQCDQSLQTSLRGRNATWGVRKGSRILSDKV